MSIDTDNAIIDMLPSLVLDTFTAEQRAASGYTSIDNSGFQLDDGSRRRSISFADDEWSYFLRFDFDASGGRAMTEAGDLGTTTLTGVTAEWISSQIAKLTPSPGGPRAGE